MRGRSKYRAVRTVLDGISFHSKGEARRWAQLKLLERAGEIRDLTRQGKIALHAGPTRKSQILLGHYVYDFRYLERVNGSSTCWQAVVEDYKKVWPPLSQWKLRHAEAEYGIKIRIT